MQSVPITTNVVSSNPLRQCVLDTTLCDRVCLWLAVGLLFSPGTPVCSTNKTDGHKIIEILLKVALSKKKQKQKKNKKNQKQTNINSLTFGLVSLCLYHISIIFVRRRCFFFVLIQQATMYRLIVRLV